jgi:hypothetical protein
LAALVTTTPAARPARTTRLAAALITGCAAASVALVPSSSATAAPARPAALHLQVSAGNLAPGAIKHTWLVILENKGFDATFTGLNQNSYLWKTLPSQGVLLKNYYGTSHFSQGNYESLVSGQATQQDVQSDCATVNNDTNTNAGIETAGGSLAANPNYGQTDSRGGVNAPVGMNGCTYPSHVPTLFNQLDAAGKTWKGYAQDLHAVANREDAACGGPGSSTADPSSTTQATDLNAPPSGKPSNYYKSAQAGDQYVAKHFPFPWFHSLIDGDQTTPVGGGTDCDANHIANLDDTTQGLVHDLALPAAQVPAFSWITPNNCSDAHDQACADNNLSGAFDSSGNPKYQAATYQSPQSYPAVNYTGGLYASDLFLKWYLPLIEQSAAFKDGGLIDVTFDEGNPPFTYTGNSFNNATDYAPTASDQPNATQGIVSDAAGENINGVNTATEPTGPNTPLSTDAAGNQLFPGPGANGFINRPPMCTSTSPNTPSNCVPGIVRGFSGTTPGSRTDTVTGSAGSATITDPKVTALDAGRGVTGTNIPAGARVGKVSDTGPLFPATAGGQVVAGSFTLADASGGPVAPTGDVTSVTLAAEQNTDPTAANYDPLFDAKDATPGGGRTGSVLISPFITPGTSTTVNYDHYSWLRTMEDLFQVGNGTATTPLSGAGSGTAGSVSAGLDGLGHLGYAATAGLAAYGADVFNNPAGTTPPPSSMPESPLAIGLPLAALIAAGGAFAVRRRRISGRPTSA